MDWIEELNFPRALANVRKDIIGDWYHDPWGWPEYNYVRRENWITMVRRANASGVCRAYPIDVPKENFGVRPAMVMEPLDRLLYQALVDYQSADIIGDLHPWVFGWRLPRKNPGNTTYSKNSVEWTRYRASISGFASLSAGGLKTDIVSCFASIPVSKLVAELEQIGRSNECMLRLSDMLIAFDRTPRRPGLPQRSKASAALANMYLKRIDQVLQKYDETRPRRRRKLFTFLGRGGVARWMDDVWVFGNDDATLRGVQMEVQDVAREASLELNMGKTTLRHGEDLITAILKIQHSAVDDALTETQPNYEPLEKLIDDITATPESADRTSIHFALRRMRAYEVRSRRNSLVEAAPRMPHGADHLARAFRDLRWWRGLDEWYLDYKESPWGRLDWSVARLGAMFPSRAKVSKKLRSYFTEILAERPSLPLLALAAQRLTSWEPSVARDAIRAAAELADHPHERRVLALAALGIEDEKDFIRRLLSEFEENAFTLAMIEKRRFAPVPPSPDFSADVDGSHPA